MCSGDPWACTPYPTGFSVFRRRAVSRGSNYVLTATVVLLAVAFAPRALPAAAVVASFLPRRRIIPPNVADPNEPKLAAEYSQAQTGRLEGFAFHIGAIAPLVELRPDAGATEQKHTRIAQASVDAGTLPILSDRAGFDLQAVDFQVGLPIDYGRGPFAARLRLGHVSSHLGDDFFGKHPNFPRRTFSRDSLTLLSSYELRNARFYAGGIYAIDADPDVARETVQSGTEITGLAFWHQRLGAYLAADLQAKAENQYEVSVNVQAGLLTVSATGRNVRLAFRFFDGHAPVGQFFQERVRWFGVGVFYFPTVGPR